MKKQITTLNMVTTTYGIGGDVVSNAHPRANCTGRVLHEVEYID